jgi:hypothetical protein
VVRVQEKGLPVWILLRKAVKEDGRVCPAPAASVSAILGVSASAWLEDCKVMQVITKENRALTVGTNELRCSRTICKQARRARCICLVSKSLKHQGDFVAGEVWKLKLCLAWIRPDQTL